MSVYLVYTSVYTPNNFIRRKRQELYLFMLKHMTDEQKFQLSGKLCQEVNVHPAVFMCIIQLHNTNNLHILHKTLWVEKFSEFTVHIQSTKALSTSIVILADLLCKAANPAVLVLPKMFEAAIHRNFLPPIFVLYSMYVANIFELAACEAASLERVGSTL